MTRYPAEREAAAKLIEERGWCQGVYEDASTGGICLEFALALAAPEKAVEISFELIRELDRNTIPWNDAPNRTKAEVLAALRRGTNTADTSPAADTEPES